MDPLRGAEGEGEGEGGASFMAASPAKRRKERKESSATPEPPPGENFSNTMDYNFSQPFWPKLSSLFVVV